MAIIDPLFQPEVVEDPHGYSLGLDHGLVHEPGHRNTLVKFART